MVNDPVELDNVIDKVPETAQQLAKQWDAWAKGCNVLPYPENKK